ncbi:MAG: hypothetical protein LBD16_00500 [Oscillospiraceae bacterium]|nr:hypothetical protein [Oscillospiraceae bacterium]
MRYLRRFLWFVTVRLFGVVLVGALLVAVFYLAMNITNIMILLSDGMTERARVITRIETDDTLLRKFFTDDSIASDLDLSLALTDSGIYGNYDVSAIDVREDIQWVWTWPWDSSASATVSESMESIDGSINAGKRDAVIAQYGEGAVNLPEWQNVTYKVTLTRIDGRWIISGIMKE